ncbi:2-oxoglutarate carboxylase small subunit [archaeon HR06]|nr:2-oxoglutarate carboxylase small subunit [archaeon HR06]
MIKRILIANRGEIALRIIRACKELNICSLAIFSDADINSLHIKYADEAYRIGGNYPSESYLKIDEIVELAKKVGADAIHPGYGFLSENPKFAEKCEKEGIIFIGPKSTTLEKTGNKLECKITLEKAGIPTLKGHKGEIKSLEDLYKVSEEIGFPILIKSVYGGGGRGLRIVRNKEELREAFLSSQLEAKEAFGRGEVYLEKYLEGARHIEIQILRDIYGNSIHLGERDCSIQRRYQKIIEMAPSPILNDELRKKVGSYALKAAEVIDYTNAGTVEFLLDKNFNFYFIEINARLQVEHPITEMVTGVDLVKEQIKIAQGEKLDLKQEDIKIRGFSIECRINAEDPLNDLMPSVGTVKYYLPPSGIGVRVDSALYSGYNIPIYYDSLIAKLITWGRDFEEARGRMVNALKDYQIEGVSTNIPLLLTILNNERFIKQDFTVNFIEEEKILEKTKMIEANKKREMEEVAAIVASLNLKVKKKKEYSTIKNLQVKSLSKGRFIDGL